MTHNAKKGQSLLEIALAIPIFLVVIFGVFDLGRVFFSTITLVNAAREGARYLTVYPQDAGNELGAFFGTMQRSVQEAAGGGISLANGQIAVTCVNGGDEDNKTCDSGGSVVVTINHNVDLVLGWLLPSPISITRSAEMIVP